MGILLIALWSKKKTVFVSGVLAALWPCAMLPSSMAINFVHVSIVKDLLASFFYVIIASPVSGWITRFAYVQSMMCC